MDIHQQPGRSPAYALFRRRVVFELTADELPLLEAAEARHGSKRKALIAALSAQARVADLERELEAAHNKSEQRQPVASKAPTEHKQALDAARVELKQANTELKRLRARLDATAGEASDAHAAAAAERDAYEQQLAERYDEIEELEQRVVDHLYCGRCNHFAPLEEWAWETARDGGDYAYHEPCGDHRPGLLDAASWLALRD